MGIKSYNSKVVVSGNIVEIYNYKNPILTGFQLEDREGLGRSSEDATEEQKGINRQKVLSRAKRDLRRLINTNIKDNSKFVTLTFKENITDIKMANSIFNKFIKRLDYALKVKTQYAVVPEFQKRGAVHYHVVLFNVGYVPSKQLSDIWGQGFIKINKIDSVDNVGAYVTKYMSKDMEIEKEDKLLGKKCYFTSRNLDKPIEINEKNLVEDVRASLPGKTKVFEGTFENEYQTITYQQYNMKR